MTNSSFVPESMEQSVNKPHKILNLSLWVFQIVLAIMFIMAGSLKLAAIPMMVQMFNTIGMGQWLRNLTGSIEILSALLLFTPRFAAWGALLLVGTMVGAVLTHLLILHTSPIASGILLLLSIFVLWGRKEQLKLKK